MFKWLSLFMSVFMMLFQPQPFTKNHPVTLQAKTSHMLIFVDNDGENMSACTGTAIGPHAILTALHCDEGEYKGVRLDRTRAILPIVDTATDGSDHVILLIKGYTFEYVEPYSVRDPKIGEKVFLYGFGHRIYPANLKTGYVLDEYDPSEVDQYKGITYYSAYVIPGDSGSAIYGQDGCILGLVTYTISEEGLFQDKNEMAGFKLNFDKEDIEYAQKY